MAKKSEAQNLFETCPKCSSKDFSVAKTSDQRRYCSKCAHVWLPMSQVELKLKAAQDEIRELKAELMTLKNQLRAQKEVFS